MYIVLVSFHIYSIYESKIDNKWIHFFQEFKGESLLEELLFASIDYGNDSLMK